MSGKEGTSSKTESFNDFYTEVSYKMYLNLINNSTNFR